jgi:type IV pilus assembly protein PilN
MIKINLLAEGKRPAAVRKAKPSQILEGKDFGLWLLLAGALIGLAAFGLLWYLRNDTIKQKDGEIMTAEKEVEELSAVIKEVDDFKAKKAELERKIKVINDLKLNQRGPVKVMDNISRSLPELLWLDHLTMTATSIELDGRAFNTNAVANFIENLDKVPEFGEPTLKDTQEQTGGVYKFVINLNYSFTPKTDKSGKGGKDAGKTGKDAGKDAGKPGGGPPAGPATKPGAGAPGPVSG